MDFERRQKESMMMFALTVFSGNACTYEYDGYRKYKSFYDTGKHITYQTDFVLYSIFNRCFTVENTGTFRTKHRTL